MKLNIKLKRKIITGKQVYTHNLSYVTQKEPNLNYIKSSQKSIRKLTIRKRTREATIPALRETEASGSL